MTLSDSLTYVELNLQTWRQLWRVLEMSDVVLMIVDIRHTVSNGLRFGGLSASVC